MTSFAFILGWVLLTLASGSGAASRGVMGTAVVFGMPSRLWSASSSSPSATSSGRAMPDWKKPVKAGIRKEPETA
ncbi:MAG: hypothetical protein JO334_18900 [Verrucomicrobia bacterium]|nr:hypothetical protein [Verrucomicrobiota bacterium]